MEATDEPNQVSANANPIDFQVRISGNLTVTVTRADNIEVEDSEIQKVLRLRNGDYSCFKTVYLVVEGQRHEITMPVQPTTNNPASTSP